MAELLPSAGAGDDVHLQFFHIAGGVLAVAAADADEGIGVELPAAADHGTVLLVRHGGDGAGVDDVAVADLVKAADLVALREQELLHGLGLVLVHLAAKGVKGKFHKYHQRGRLRHNILIIIIQENSEMYSRKNCAAQRRSLIPIWSFSPRWQRCPRRRS